MNNTSNKPFFITTPIYYVNGLPHIGHAYTTVVADVIARFKRLQGREVFFSTGTDEHGMKIQKKAEEEGKEVQIFVDEIVKEFQSLWKQLNIDYTKFIRTTDSEHKKVVQKVLQDFYDRGVIYKGFYEGLYCVGCEQFKTADELVDGKCPDHDRVPEFTKEESYLMKMTSIQEELVAKIKSDELLITPEKYKAEILSFLTGETLNDISISRKNVSWGVPLPFDMAHTTYVWVDAFLNYLTVLGWDGDANNVPKEWPANIQFIGKDILRVHATIWPAILLHLGLPLQKILFTHGHILSGGKKMSKTLGNTIAISEMLERFGVDGTRYLLMTAGTFGDDVDLTMERMTEKYNADLANGLGNLVSRVLKLSEQLSSEERAQMEKISGESVFTDVQKKEMEVCNISRVLESIWEQVRFANKLIDDEKPWELAKSDLERFKGVMITLLGSLHTLGQMLVPFMPETSEKIVQALESGKVEPLFQRIK